MLTNFKDLKNGPHPKKKKTKLKKKIKSNTVKICSRKIMEELVQFF